MTIQFDIEPVSCYSSFATDADCIGSSEKKVRKTLKNKRESSKEELKEFDEQAVKGVRKNSYGVEALVDKLKMPKDYKTDMATLEEIIVFLSKGQEE